MEVFNGAVSGISDLLLYDVCITGPTAAPAARDDAHRWANEVAQNVQYEEDHHVGIVGQPHLADALRDVEHDAEHVGVLIGLVAVG